LRVRRPIRFGRWPIQPTRDSVSTIKNDRQSINCPTSRLRLTFHFKRILMTLLILEIIVGAFKWVLWLCISFN
jgi:hypothetical protein